MECGVEEKSVFEWKGLGVKSGDNGCVFALLGQAEERNCGVERLKGRRSRCCDSSRASRN
jgi:hypothetical protein